MFLTFQALYVDRFTDKTVMIAEGKQNAHKANLLFLSKKGNKTE